MHIAPFSQDISKLYRKFRTELHDNNYYKRLEFLLNENGIYYGDSLNFSLANVFNQPAFYNENMFNYFQNLVNNINLLFTEIYNVINLNPQFSKYLGVDLKSFDYRGWDLNPAKVFRIDCGVLRSNHQLKFIEFNTNNPGGFVNNDGIESILFENDPILDELRNEYNISRISRFSLFAKMLSDAYDKFKIRTSKDLGNYAIILGTETDGDIAYLQIRNELKKLGFEVDIVMNSDSNLKYDGERVTYKSKPVAIINRRIESKKSLNPICFLKEASTKDHVSIINPFGSRVLGMKKLFVLLNNTLFQSLLSQPSVDLIKQYIPKTYGFSSFIDKLTNFDVLISDKDNFVIKVNNSEKGEGVYLGRDYSDMEWQKLIFSLKKEQDQLKTGSLIVQEYLDFTQILGRNYDYSFLSIGGQFAPFVRVAKKNMTKSNIAQGGSYVPCFKYEKI